MNTVMYYAQESRTEMATLTVDRYVQLNWKNNKKQFVNKTKLNDFQSEMMIDYCTWLSN